jgi:RimJ/RimL family protein N-acetyltransferase
MTGIADGSWPVHTKRLTIRPAVDDDLEATWRFRRIPSVGQWLTSQSEDLAAYTEHWKIPGRSDTTLIVERDGEVIADLMLRVEDAWSQAEVREQARGVQAEIGWCFDPAVGGQGYATEAVAELIRICFEDLRLRRVTANCFADNVPSWRLMERLDMRREQHTVRESLHRDGRWLDGFGYALLADEWRAR